MQHNNGTKYKNEVQIPSLTRFAGIYEASAVPWCFALNHAPVVTGALTRQSPPDISQILGNHSCVYFAGQEHPKYCEENSKHQTVY